MPRKNQRPPKSPHPLTTDNIVRGSFRDPSGYLFRGADGVVYRQINNRYREHYDRFRSTHLYDDLTKAKLLVPHVEIDDDLSRFPDAYKIIRPEQIPFISYPYEWCFSQLRDAALLTLEIQKRCLEKGMSLKDASAYNIQFCGAKPIFIDTLSFERLPEGQPWIAYKQFCQHFLAPLALMAHVNPDLIGLMRVHLDGIPLPLAAKMLPGRTKLSPGLVLHIHAHAKMIERFGSKPGDAARGESKRKMSMQGLKGILSSLESAVQKLHPAKSGSVWFGYAETAPYAAGEEDIKKKAVAEFVGSIRPASVWDLGANTGVYSEIAREHAQSVVAMEFDHACVESAYTDFKARGVDVLPIRMDLTNPSPAMGWAHRERDALVDRGPAGMVMALALIHHICITNNVPLSEFAEYLARLGKHAIVEFVDKPDPMVQHLLSSREDIFDHYTPNGFKHAFSKHFEFVDHRDCGEAHRTLYLLKRR